MQRFTASDMILIFSAAGGLFIFIGTVVGLALKLQKFITDEFRNHRKIMHGMFSQRDRAIRRLEFWAVQQRNGFQPGVDPLDFGGNNGNGGAQQ